MTFEPNPLSCDVSPAVVSQSDERSWAPLGVGLTCAVLMLLTLGGSFHSQWQPQTGEREADLPRPVLLTEKRLRLLFASGLEEDDVAGSSQFGILFSQVTAPSQLTPSVSPGRGSSPAVLGSLPRSAGSPGLSCAPCACGCQLHLRAVSAGETASFAKGTKQLLTRHLNLRPAAGHQRCSRCSRGSVGGRTFPSSHLQLLSLFLSFFSTEFHFLLSLFIFPHLGQKVAFALLLLKGFHGLIQYTVMYVSY